MSYTDDKYDDLPRVQQSPLTDALFTLMSDLSEESWAAGWMSGTEEAIWEIHMGRRDSWGMNGGSGMHASVAAIATVAEVAGAWIIYTMKDGETPVDLGAWRERQENENSRPTV